MKYGMSGSIPLLLLTSTTMSIFRVLLLGSFLLFGTLVSAQVNPTILDISEKNGTYLYKLADPSGSWQQYEPTEFVPVANTSAKIQLSNEGLIQITSAEKLSEEEAKQLAADFAVNMLEQSGAQQTSVLPELEGKEHLLASYPKYQDNGEHLSSVLDFHQRQFEWIQSNPQGYLDLQQAGVLSHLHIIDYNFFRQLNPNEQARVLNSVGACLVLKAYPENSLPVIDNSSELSAFLGNGSSSASETGTSNSSGVRSTPSNPDPNPRTYTAEDDIR